MPHLVKNIYKTLKLLKGKLLNDVFLRSGNAQNSTLINFYSILYWKFWHYEKFRKKMKSYRFKRNKYIYKCNFYFMWQFLNIKCIKRSIKQLLKLTMNLVCSQDTRLMGKQSIIFNIILNIGKGNKNNSIYNNIDKQEWSDHFFHFEYIYFYLFLSILLR